MKAIIGITGPMRSGKTTVQGIIKEELTSRGYKVSQHTFSDVLVDTCKLWHQPMTRDNLIGISQVLRQFWGSDAMAHAVRQRILLSEVDVVVLAGLRMFDADYPFLRSFSNSYLVYINAPPELCWRRSVENPEKPDEAGATFEDFTTRNQASTETEVPMFKEHADIVIDNFGFSVDDLGEIAKEFLRRINL